MELKYKIIIGALSIVILVLVGLLANNYLKTIELNAGINGYEKCRTDLMTSLVQSLKEVGYVKVQIGDDIVRLVPDAKG